MKKLFWHLRNKHTKLPAFTLMETMVVLLLLVIVFAVASTALRITQQQLHTFVTSSQQHMHLRSFSKAIRSDMTQSKHVFVRDHGLRLLMGSRLHVEYIFGEHHAIRRYGDIAQDTFWLKDVHLSFFFRDGPINEIGEKIDELHVKYNIDGMEYPLIAHKYEDAVNLLEWDRLSDQKKAQISLSK